MDTVKIEKSKRLLNEWLTDCREIIKFPNVRDNVILFSQNADNIFRYNVGLGMLVWREGGNPRPFLTEAIDEIERYRDDLASRAMNTTKLPIRTAAIIASLLDRQSEFELGDCELDACGDLFLDCCLAKRLQGRPVDEGIQAGFEQLRKAKRHTLAIRTYEAYFHLIDLDASSAEVDKGLPIAEANYAARRKDSYYSGGPDIEGGGKYNDMVIDYRLAAVIKYRGIDRDSVHRWRW